MNLRIGRILMVSLDPLRYLAAVIVDQFSSHPTRYAYAALFNPVRPFTFDGVMKLYDDSNTTTTFKYGDDRYGGEAVFVPRTNATGEDDGYLVCFFHDEAENQSECLILDAQDIEAGPVATIMMPFRVPYGFHAGWISAA